jgi:hypothetical protein
MINAVHDKNYGTADVGSLFKCGFELCEVRGVSCFACAEQFRRSLDQFTQQVAKENV